MKSPKRFGFGTTNVEKLHSSPAALAVRDEFFSTGDASRVLAACTAAVGSAIFEEYNRTLAPVLPSGLTLVATGGFGRQEMYPGSDVDLLVLVDSELCAGPQRDALSGFLQSLWDSGLRVSHSVHTPGECCEYQDRNVELGISLLDRRFLAGDRELFIQLETKLPRFFHGRWQEFARQLCRLTRTRHQRYSNTIYHLEPNVKEGPGGLRDYQVIRWLEQLRDAQPYRLPEPAKLPELEPAVNLLSTVRCYLHYTAGRDSNLLTFDAQEDIAGQCFTPASSAAVWMREYFLQARSIYRAAVRSVADREAVGSSLFYGFRDWRSRLSNTEFTVSREQVYFRSPSLLERDPDLAIRLFTFVARHGIRLAADTEWRIAGRLRDLRAHFSVPRPLWRAIEGILALPHAAKALRSMHENSILDVLFPEWKGIDCLVLRDFHHRYTVDEHTLVSIGVLEELRGTTDPTRARFAELFAEIERPGLLLFALLFHDTGKAVQGSAHTDESVRLAREAMSRIGAPRDACENVCFLIERHLDLSGVLNSRDLGEAATAKYLASRAETVERLKYLTLLTYADISAVNPTAMNPWRLDQLWRLYMVAYNELTNELDTDRIVLPVADSPAKAKFLEGLPTRYLRTRTPEEIEAHFQLWRSGTSRGVAIDVKRLNGVYLLTVVTRDRPFLFASLAGSLAGFGMNILKAEAFANRRGEVLDTFIFADPSRTFDLNPTEVDRFRFTLERVISGKLDVNRLLGTRPKPRRPTRQFRIRPSVSFAANGSPTASLVEIVAEDRPGLLYDLAKIFSASGASIDVVLVDTEAQKAIDVFYVTLGGKKLPPELETSLRDALLAACRPAA